MSCTERMLILYHLSVCPPLYLGDRAAQEFRDLLVKWLGTGELDAKKVCLISHYAFASKGLGVEDLGLDYQNGGGGNYWRKCKQALNLDYVETEFYWIYVAMSGKHAGSRKKYWIPIRPPDERLLAGWTPKDMAKWSDDDKTLFFKNHPVRRMVGDDNKVLVYSFYLDTTPFSSESFYGIFVTNLITGDSHLCAVILKSDMCSCGCRGHCTMFEIHSAMAHFMRALAIGKYPDHRHDDRAWLPSDEERAARAGKPMPCHGLCEQFKGDHPELCFTLGFKSHKSNDAPCFCCECTSDTLCDFSCCSESHQGWGDEMTMEKWKEEVDRCEVKVIVRTVNELKSLNAKLHFDDRPYGYKGRALFAPYPEKGLIKGDRLEPSRSLRDVHDLEFITEFPVELTFWRTSQERRLNRANHFFNHVPGLTYLCLCLCELHILNLGVLGKYIAFCFYFVLLRNVFELHVSTQDELLSFGMLRLRDKLWAHYKREHVVDPSQNISRVHNLTVGMLGDKAHRENPTMHLLRGGEIRSLLTFTVSLLKEFQHRLPPREALFLVQAGEHLLAYYSLCRQYGRVMPEGVVRRLFFHALRHIKLFSSVGGQLIPKHHFWIHLILQSKWLGNPRMRSTMQNESINGLVARVAATCHRATFVVTVFQKWCLQKTYAARRLIGACLR